MRGTLASSERTVDVKTAIDEVQRVLRDAGKLNYRTPSGEFPHQSAASLIGKNGVIVASRGKGLGRQCEASALFELYEHAVSMGVVERIDSNAEISTAQLYKGGALNQTSWAATSGTAELEPLSLRPSTRSASPQARAWCGCPPRYTTKCPKLATIRIWRWLHDTGAPTATPPA